MINIALPSGRIGNKSYCLLERAGYTCPGILEPNRRLTFVNEEKGVRYFWVKPSDVAIYVERGAADVGVCGADILREYEPEVYELLDLGIGRCRMCVCGKKDFFENAEKTLKIATKFPNITRKYYEEAGRDIDIIKLNGSIEIAPLLGLSDVIVDIVETGNTLRENGLELLKEILPISARFICNKVSFQFKNGEIVKMRDRLSEIKERL
jgi:ATP phosphoribosyltransferase